MSLMGAWPLLLSLAWQTPAAPGPAKKPAARPVLEGVVKGPDGKPVEKALVLSRPSTSVSGDPSLHARTDAGGRFRIELRSDQPHDVRVEAAGLAAQRLEKVRPGAALSVVLGKGGFIEGIVRDSQTGAAVAGARVTARDESGLAPPGLGEPDAGLVQATADAKGQFRLEGLASGLHALSARGPTGSGRRPGVRTGTRIELLLVPGATLFGRVTGRQGQPVAGAAVSAQREERAALEAPAEKTDAAGRFEVAGLAAGTYWLTVSHPDFAPGVRVGLAVERDTAVSADVVLEAGNPVRGRLVDEGGRPRAGQVVVQEVEDREAPPALAALLRAQAGADGRFELPRVAPGSYALAAAAPGLAPQRVEVGVSPPAGKPVDVGDVILEAGIAIRGRVRSGAGSAVAGAEVRARPSQPPFSGTPAEGQTEADGGFVLAGVNEGPYLVGARAPGYAMATAEAIGGSEGLELVLAPGGAITGMVVDEAGKPVEGSSILAEPTSRGMPLSMIFPGRANGTSGPDGRFTLEDLAEGGYTVQAEAPELAPNGVGDVKVVAGQTTDAGRIRLRAGGVVRGTVVSGGGGAVGGATVSVRPSSSDWRTGANSLAATSGPNGSFEIKGVPPGSAEVAATHPRHSPANSSVEVDPAKGPAEARLVLGEGGRIEGWARRRDGTPLRGRIRAMAPRLTRGRAPVEMVAVQPNGSFVIEHVEPGTVQVILLVGTAASLASALSKDVEVREGETTTVDLTLRDILLSGQVTRRGLPLPRVRVSAPLGRRRGPSMFAMIFGRGGPTAPAASAEPQRGTALTGDDGRYEMLLDEPGDIRLRVETLDGQTELASRRETIPDADAHVADFALAGVAVTGVVVDHETEAPVRDASVSAVRQDGEGQQRARTGPDGRFTLELEPGEYRVAATRDGYNVESRAVTVDEEGLDGLRMALTKGTSP